MIKSLNNLNNKVLKGCTGTVLNVYPDFPPAYEVEFVNEALENIDVLTVKANEIIKVER